MSDVIDSVVKSQLQTGAQLATLVRRIVLKKRHHWELDQSVTNAMAPKDALLSRPNPLLIFPGTTTTVIPQGIDQNSTNKVHEDIFNVVQAQGSAMQCHCNDPHNNTCHKGLLGMTGCRFCFRCPDSQKTEPILLCARRGKRLKPNPKVCEWDGVSDSDEHSEDSSKDAKSMGSIDVESDDDDWSVTTATFSDDGLFREKSAITATSPSLTQLMHPPPQMAWHQTRTKTKSGKRQMKTLLFMVPTLSENIHLC